MIITIMDNSFIDYITKILSLNILNVKMFKTNNLTSNTYIICNGIPIKKFHFVK